MNNDKFTEIYQKFFARVYNFIYARLKNSATADDLTSEVFMRVYQKFETFRGDSAMSTWIFQIASNAIADHFRRQGRNREDDWEEFFDRAASSDAEPEVQLLKSEGREELFRALDRLTERERRVIELKYFGGLSNGEIAILLELGYSNVGFINHRAIEKLRAALEKISRQLI